MYCSSCGASVTRGLNYCNHCGARLSAAKSERAEKQSELFPESLVWAIVTVFVCGLGGIIGLMAVMKEVLHFSESLIIAFTMLSFALLFVVEGVLIRLLRRQKKHAVEAGDAEVPQEQATKELGPAHARTLSEPVSSVTEHATRAFEPIRRE